MNGCLTVWLWLILIGNILGVIFTALAPLFFEVPDLPKWYLPVSIAATVCVVISAVGLLKWKVWGFWGLVAMQGVSVLISIAESGNYIAIASGAMGVVILVLLLNMGGENKTWNYLE
jgi:hypothetical protein